jgi:hypothetical protein
MTMRVLLRPDSSHVKQFAGAGFPIIPVALHRVEGKWKKQPLVGWDKASTSEEVIEGWWRCWPEALPGIPLRYTTLVVVDADRRDGVDGVGELSALKMLGPHSKIATPSGGLHMVFAQPDPPITSRFQWCKGVEVMGSSGLLTCYDLEALRFPYVAPRAILPEMFRRPRDRGEPPSKVPRIKSREERDAAVGLGPQMMCNFQTLSSCIILYTQK